MKLGLIVFEQHEYAQAEAIAKPLVSLAAPPGAPWLLSEARSVLGGALAAQGRFDEAERELIEAHDGLVALGARIPAQEKPMIAQTVDRLVALYRARGNDERASFWASRQPPSR